MKKEVKDKSLAMTLVHDAKVLNKRLFIILLIVLFMWFTTICYLVYVLNDIEYEEVTTETTTSQEIKDVDSIDNSYIINGGMYGDN